MYPDDKKEFLTKAYASDFDELVWNTTEEQRNKIGAKLVSFKLMEKACDYANLLVRKINIVKIQNKGYKDAMRTIRSIVIEYTYDYKKRERNLQVKCKDKTSFGFFKTIVTRQQDALVSLAYLIDKIDFVLRFFNESSLRFLYEKEFGELKNVIQDIMQMFPILDSYFDEEKNNVAV